MLPQKLGIHNRKTALGFATLSGFVMKLTGCVDVSFVAV